MKTTAATTLLILQALLLGNAQAEFSPNPYRPDIRPLTKAPKQTESEPSILPDRDPRIIGGKESTEGAHPWIAALIRGDEADLYYGQYGGGVLIHPYWVLTAGHCIEGMEPEDVDVVLGAHDLDDPSGTEQRIAAAELILHPLYNDLTLFSDIGLIRLATPAEVRFQPLPLIDETSLEAPGTMSHVAGWGVIDNEYTFTDILLEVDLPIVDLATANASTHYEGTLVSSMLPAGYAAGGKDSAPGDSGGPLTVPGADGSTPVLAGIVSFGPGAGSGLPNGYGIYSRVSSFRSFIFSHVMPKYDQWEILHGVTGRYRDNDGDGRLNIDEFAFGCNPLVKDAIAPGITISGGHPHLRFKGPQNPAAVSYQVAHAPALDQTFSDIGSDELIIARDDAGLSRDWITMEDPGSASSQGFYRLQAAIAERVVIAPRSLPLNAYAAHTLTSMDEPVEGSGPPQYLKRYILDGLTTGQSTTLILRSADFNASLKLHNAATGALLQQSSSNNAGGTDEELDFIPQSGISYEVRVSNVPGNFMLASRNFNGIPALPYETSQSGSLSSSEPYDPDYLPFQYRTDKYLFSRTADTDIRITMTSGSYSPACLVFNAETGALITSNSGNGSTTVNFFALTGVRYEVVATSEEENRTGSYQLLAEEDNIPTIAVGQSLMADLSASDATDPYYGTYIDDYLLTGASVGQAITVSQTSNAFDTYLIIVDRQTGEMLYENDDFTPGNITKSQLTFTTEVGKTYIIRAASYDPGETGSYQLTVN